MLRYEPARAFRTLLISYRLALAVYCYMRAISERHVFSTPMQSIPTNNVNAPSLAETYQTQGNQAVELELPYAMRVWRPRNSKLDTKPKLHSLSLTMLQVSFTALQR